MSSGKTYVIGVAIETVEGMEDVPFAIAAVRQAITAINADQNDAIALLGSSATRTAIESRIRKLVRTLQSGDRVVFVYAGPGQVTEGVNSLACADTLEDDRLATSISIADLQRSLEVPGVETVFILDADGIDTDDLASLFDDHESQACLTACSTDEPSHSAAGQRLWLELVAEAASGKAPKASIDQKVTVDSFQRWVDKELPKSLRKTVAKKATQSPVAFGNVDIVLADLARKSIPASARIDLEQLQQLVFRGESRTKLKDARGAMKGSKLPDAVNSSTKKWAIRLAADDLREAIESTYNGLREHLGLKRKDLESSISTDGVGTIRGPHFDTTIDVQLDPVDPSYLLWRREVSRLTDASVLRSEGFRRVFGGKLDSLEISFARPVDVIALVDRIEDDPPPGTRVQVASDGSSCEVRVQGLAGCVRIDRHQLRIDGGTTGGTESLLEQFLAFQLQFANNLPAIAQG